MGTHDHAAGSIIKAPPLAMGLRVHLSVMMFLEFAIWGAWFVVLGNYLGAMEFSKTDIGLIYANMSLGAIFSPMFIGQIADRYFSSERLMAFLHLLGAALLYWMAQLHDPDSFFGVSLLYALVYSPTLALANSIAFTHVPDGTRDFPGLRVLGTIGWIVANLIVGQFLDMKTNQPLLLAAVFSLVLGVYSLALPHTPPLGKAGDAIPFVRALGLLREPSFAVFYGVSFVITIVLAFYYNFTGLYLEHAQGVGDVASLMTIGQFAEMLLLPLLPFFLIRMGMKWVLALGMLAWGLRYGIFAVGQPFWLVVVGLALHGLCFDFFFAAGFIHVDNKSPSTIRASAQALFSFLTYGLGMWLGGIASGQLGDYFTDPVTNATNWSAFWTVPCVGVLISLAIFVVFFRDRGKAPVVQGAPEPQAA
jgi:nucleoside transporter